MIKEYVSNLIYIDRPITNVYCIEVIGIKHELKWPINGPTANYDTNIAVFLTAEEAELYRRTHLDGVVADIVYIDHNKNETIFSESILPNIFNRRKDCFMSEILDRIKLASETPVKLLSYDNVDKERLKYVRKVPEQGILYQFTDNLHAELANIQFYAIGAYSDIMGKDTSIEIHEDDVSIPLYFISVEEAKNFIAKYIEVNENDTSVIIPVEEINNEAHYLGFSNDEYFEKYIDMVLFRATLQSKLNIKDGSLRFAPKEA